MRMRVVSSKSEINSLSPNEKMIHLAFRASNVDFLNLMQKCPRLRVVQVPPSYMKTLSRAIRAFMEMQGVELLEGDVWGHRKDLDEYFTVQEETVDDIQSMTSKGLGFDQMVDEIQKDSRLSSDLIKYIARTKLSA